MRIVFMGTPEFAVPTLDALVEAGHEVALVVTRPDAPAGRGRRLESPPVALRAEALGLPLAQPRALKSGPFPEQFCGLGADAAVVIAYGRILPQRLLDAPLHGCVNVHASLLPRWRGAAPIQAAILAGDSETGVCTQRMEAGLDTGPVHLEKRTPIGPRETAGELHDRLSLLSAEVAVETMPLLGMVEPRPQDESAATWAPKIEKVDGVVSFHQSSVDIDRRVRAMTPWPGGQVPFQGSMLKLLQVRPVPGRGSPGVLLSTNPLVVACLDGALELISVQAPGRKPVSGVDLANGLRLQPGDML